MKIKTRLCSTGHGTGASQQTPLHRSALLRGPRRVVLGALMSERELNYQAIHQNARSRGAAHRAALRMAA